MTRLDYLGALEVAGLDRKAVDMVVNTHMHPDHIGANTFMVDGSRRPTFPNARYLVVDSEWEAPKDGEDGDFVEEQFGGLFAEGRVDVVKPDHRLTDRVRLWPTPGHTSGHVAVVVASLERRVVISGDVVHHKLQLLVPDQPVMGEATGALDTRRAFYEDLADTDVVVIGAHFEEPFIGYIGRAGTGYWFDGLVEGA